MFYLLGGGTVSEAQGSKEQTKISENLNAPASAYDETVMNMGENDISTKSKYDEMTSEVITVDTTNKKGTNQATSLNSEPEEQPKKFKPVPERGYTSRKESVTTTTTTPKVGGNQNSNSNINKELVEALWRKDQELAALKRKRKLEELNEELSTTDEQPQQNEAPKVGNSFYSTTKANRNISKVGFAVIVDEKEVTNGSLISIRLMSDFILKNSKVIPSGTVFSGIITINGERANIKINGLKLDNEILNVDLYCVDAQDGLEGINCPLSAETLAKRNLQRQSSSILQAPMVDSRLLSQGINIGTNATRNYINRKSNIQKLIVRSNHQIYIYQR